MSADAFQSEYASVMESMMKTAMAQTTKLVESMVNDLKAEISRVKTENERLRSVCGRMEEPRNQPAVQAGEGRSASAAQTEDHREVAEKHDQAVQCDLANIAELTPLQQDVDGPTKFILRPHQCITDIDGNSQITFTLVKHESDCEAAATLVPGENVVDETSNLEQFAVEEKPTEELLLKFEETPTSLSFEGEPRTEEYPTESPESNDSPSISISTVMSITEEEFEGAGLLNSPNSPWDTKMLPRVKPADVPESSPQLSAAALKALSDHSYNASLTPARRKKRGRKKSIRPPPKRRREIAADIPPCPTLRIINSTNILRLHGSAVRTRSKAPPPRRLQEETESDEASSVTDVSSSAEDDVQLTEESVPQDMFILHLEGSDDPDTLDEIHVTAIPEPPSQNAPVIPKQESPGPNVESHVLDLQSGIMLLATASEQQSQRDKLLSCERQGYAENLGLATQLCGFSAVGDPKPRHEQEQQEEKRAQEGRIREGEERRIREGEEGRIREEKERQFREEKERRIREEKERQFREEEERQIREEEERQIREEEERQIREEEERRIREEEERQIREEEERRIREEEERRIREEEERRIREEEERRIREEEERRIREEEERRIREEEERGIREEEERGIREEEERGIREEEERRIREEEERRIREEEERRIREEEERRIREEEERRIREEEERQIRGEEERQIRGEEERQIREEEERQIRGEEERQIREEEERPIREEQIQEEKRLRDEEEEKHLQEEKEKQIRGEQEPTADGLNTSQEVEPELYVDVQTHGVQKFGGHRSLPHPGMNLSPVVRLKRLSRLPFGDASTKPFQIPTELQTSPMHLDVGDLQQKTPLSPSHPSDPPSTISQSQFLATLAVLPKHQRPQKSSCKDGAVARRLYLRSRRCKKKNLQKTSSTTPTRRPGKDSALEKKGGGEEHEEGKVPTAKQRLALENKDQPEQVKAKEPEQTVSKRPVMLEDPTFLSEMNAVPPPAAPRRRGRPSKASLEALKNIPKTPQPSSTSPGLPATSENDANPSSTLQSFPLSPGRGKASRKIRSPARPAADSECNQERLHSDICTPASPKKSKDEPSPQSAAACISPKRTKPANITPEKSPRGETTPKTPFPYPIYATTSSPKASPTGRRSGSLLCSKAVVLDGIRRILTKRPNKVPLSPEKCLPCSPVKKVKLIRTLISSKKSSSSISRLRNAAKAKAKRRRRRMGKEIGTVKTQGTWIPPTFEESEIIRLQEEEVARREAESSFPGVDLMSLLVMKEPITSPLQPLTVIGKHLLRNQCGECGCKFSCSVALEKHVSMHRLYRPFSCKLCGKSYPDSRSFKRHDRVHRNGRIHVCPQCGKGFVYRFGLAKHIRMVHQRIKPFICQICNKSYATRQEIVAHTRTHTGEKPFVCDFCEKRFTRRVQLNMHLRRHLGERRFWCSNCNKGFMDLSNLKKHMLIHTGEKPHCCPHCAKSFTQSGHLTKHMRNVHCFE